MAFTLKAFALSVVMVLAIPMWAAGQTVYRCGNKYQDTPCEGAGQAKQLPKTTSSPAAERTVTDPQCASRGEASLKISWAREAGATMDKQLSEANSGEQQRLVASVYAKRGSAPAIRAQVEAECQQEQEKRRAAQELARAAAQLNATLPPESETRAPAQSQPTAAEASGVRQAKSADSRKSVCDSLSAQMESLRAQQRTGGSAKDMERMNEQQRALQTQMRTSGCS